MLEIHRYLNIRSARGGAFTADGETVAFVTNITGVPQAWSIPVDGGWPQQLTFGDDRVGSVFTSPTDPELVIFERDQGGNERMQLHAVRPDGTYERPLIQNPDAIHRFGDFAPDGSRFTFASNARNGIDFDLYIAPIEGGGFEMLTELQGWVIPGNVSPDGSTCLVTVLRSNMDSDVLCIDMASGDVRPFTTWEEEARNLAASFDASGKHFFLLSDHDSDFLQAYRVELATEIATRFGPAGWDVTDLAVRGHRGALIVNEDGASRLHLFESDTLANGEEIPLPTGVATDLVFSADGTRLALTIDGAVHPPDVWIAEPSEPSLSKLTKSSTAGIDPRSFVMPKTERIESFDGLSVPLWLYLPVGAEDDQAPVVVSVHGGPEAQELPSFNPIYQYLLAHGYAIVAPNVRGSSGYGRAYLELDDIEKRSDAIADLAEIAQFVKGRSDLDGSKMAVMGGSYGGFMVLASLTSNPELWSAGVDIVGIANLVTFLENTGDYRRKLREAEYGSLKEDRELLREISPIHQVEKIEAPLLVIHGANDPRVPLLEATQIVERLRELDRTVEFRVFGDEGHGLVKLENRKEAYSAVVEFLDRYLSD